MNTDLKNIATWANKRGFNWDYIGNQSADGFTATGVLIRESVRSDDGHINPNYNAIENYATRTGRRWEHRGHYQAIAIYARAF